MRFWAHVFSLVIAAVCSGAGLSYTLRHQEYYLLCLFAVISCVIVSKATYKE